MSHSLSGHILREAAGDGPLGATGSRRPHHRREEPMPEFNTAQTLIEAGQLTEADRRRIIRDHLSSQGWSFGREGRCGLPERRKPLPPGRTAR